MTDLLPPPGEVPGADAASPGADPEILHRPLQETAVILAEATLETLPDAIGNALGEVATVLEEVRVEPIGPPFVRYLELGDTIRAEIGFPVNGVVPLVGRVVRGRLPGGLVARILHVGPYDGLAATYARLEDWLASQGRRPAGPFWEVYWSDPDAEPDPATWRTEIFAPLDG
jgi:effector-binding domain-containing protein